MGVTETPTGKGRPTPKRPTAKGPVAPPPTSRKEAAKQLRSKQAEQRQRIKSGHPQDESAMMPRDRGPVRRLVRDVVDARRNIGWMLMPIALAVIIAGLLKNTALQGMTFGVFAATVLGTAFDLVMLRSLLKRRISERFPDEKHRGHIGYGLMRSTQFRRIRMPKPAVDRNGRAV